MMLQRGTELVRERWRKNRPSATPQDHWDAALAWLIAAQDSSDDAGVSHSYLIGERWMRSYPETTGYIIPTFLNYARVFDSDDAERRALAMADWELTVQLDNGAIPNLTSGEPVIFDTGQVMFGWMSAYHHTQDARYLEAARRGAGWLATQMHDDGVWRHPSDSGGPGRVYNARVAWALLELAQVDADHEAAARRFLDWTLTQHRKDGWYDHNCLTHDEAPLLHTIAYTARGQLESGLLLSESRYVEASLATARTLASLVGPDGHLAGRFFHDWQPAVKWACLTGMAQTSIIWQRMVANQVVTGEEAETFLARADAVNAFLMRTQDRSSDHPGLRGGIRGSFPVNGTYGQWRVLNWATKFFIDALLWRHHADRLQYAG